MPGQFPIESFFDIQSIKTEYDTLLDLNQQLADSIKQLSSGEGMTKFIDSIKTLRSESANTEFAINGLVTQMERLNAQQQTLNTTVRAHIAQTDNQIQNTLRLREATRQQTQQVQAAENTYKGLSAQQAIAIRNAKDLAVQFGVDSQAAKDAAASALLLTNQLKAIDASVGQHQRNVGNYGGSLSKLRIGFTDFARVLTGEGLSIRSFASSMALVGPAIAIAGAAIYGLIELLRKQTDAEKLAAAHKKILLEQQNSLYDSFKNQNEAAQSAIKNATEEQVKVDLLVKSLKQHNLTKKEQIEVVNKLKDLAPDYFDNLDAEHLKIDQLDISRKPGHRFATNPAKSFAANPARGFFKC